MWLLRRVSHALCFSSAVIMKEQPRGGVLDEKKHLISEKNCVAMVVIKLLCIADPRTSLVCKATRISFSQTHLTVSQTNFPAAHLSNFTPLRLDFVSQHGAMSSLSPHLPPLPSGCATLISRPPPSGHLSTSPSTPAVSFENFPLHISSLPSSD